MREICLANDVKIISGGLSPDHVHLLISAPPGLSISRVAQYVKGKSSRKLLREFEVLRRRYWGRRFWARGYFAVTVGNANTEEVQRRIEEREERRKEDNFKISEF
jgi:putative transposase